MCPRSIRNPKQPDLKFHGGNKIGWDFFILPLTWLFQRLDPRNLQWRQKSKWGLENPMRPEDKEKRPETNDNKRLNSPWFSWIRNQRASPAILKEKKNEDVLWRFRSPYAHQYCWIGVGCGFGDRVSGTSAIGIQQIVSTNEEFGANGIFWANEILPSPFVTCPDSWLQCWRARGICNDVKMVVGSKITQTIYQPVNITCQHFLPSFRRTAGRRQIYDCPALKKGASKATIMS